MSFSGALGRGSYQSVVAGAQSKHLRTKTRRKNVQAYYPLGPELIALKEQHQSVQKKFYIRDSIFDNRMKETRKVNGMFKLPPDQRLAYHYQEVMPAIRKRTITMIRVQQQRAINDAILGECISVEDPIPGGAPKKGIKIRFGNSDTISTITYDAERDPRAAFVSADANVYFAPMEHQGTNPYPNYWQHETVRHVVPQAVWRRHPEMGGITRVHNVLKEGPTSY